MTIHEKVRASTAALALTLALGCSGGDAVPDPMAIEEAPMAEAAASVEAARATEPETGPMIGVARGDRRYVVTFDASAVGTGTSVSVADATGP